MRVATARRPLPRGPRINTAAGSVAPWVRAAMASASSSSSGAIQVASA
ncbi:MAG: hypothetical protein IPL61_40850 [Myxococcales bacterium]|nr:hypothetical protein [Myxococcales bacterium]